MALPTRRHRPRMLDYDCFSWSASPRQIEFGLIPLRAPRMTAAMLATIESVAADRRKIDACIDSIKRHLLTPVVQRIQLPATALAVQAVIVMPKAGAIIGLWPMREGEFSANGNTANCSGHSPLMPGVTLSMNLVHSAARLEPGNTAPSIWPEVELRERQWASALAWTKVMMDLRSEGLSEIAVRTLMEKIALPWMESVYSAESALLAQATLLSRPEPEPATSPTLDDLIRLRNRVQCCVAYPSLESVLPAKLRLSRTLRAEITAQQHQLLCAIDEGCELAPTLAKVLEIPRWAVNRFRHPPRSFGPRGLAFVELIQRLRYMAPDIAPRTPEGYSQFDLFFGAADSPLLPALKRASGDGQMRELARLLQPGAYRELLGYVVVLSATRQLAACTENTDLPSLDDLLDQPSLRDWIALSNRWRSVESLFSQRITITDTQQARPPLFDRPVVIDDFEFVCLTTKAALQEEGRIMQHCIGERTSRYLHGELGVLSVRHRGQHHSTLSLRIELRAGQMQARIDEHFGPRNRHPGDGAVEAAGKLLADIQFGKLRIPFAFLRKRGVAWQRPHDWSNQILSVGMAWKNIGTNGVERYRPVLEISPGRGQLYERVLEYINDPTSSLRLGCL